MMIDYSVAAKPNPRDRDAAPKFYAMAQCRGVVNLNQFAKHIATHGCVYKRADIAAVLTMAVDCLQEMLLNGYKVELGDMGSFYLSLSSEGTETAKEFNPAIHVKEVNVNWERGVNFVDLKKEAEFNLVAIRSVQKQVLKALKNGETVIDLNGEPTDDEPTDENPDPGTSGEPAGGGENTGGNEDPDGDEGTNDDGGANFD